jgi:hypothetical protein
MTTPRRRALIGQLRLLSLINPKKWHMLNEAADEIESLYAELERLRNARA